MSDVTTMWTSLVSSAVVSATVQLIAKYYFDARLERDKAQLLDAVNAKVEPLKASLQWQTDRLHTMFSALQTERLQAIKDLYIKIVNVEALLNYLAVEKTVSNESVASFSEAVHAFITYYLANRIWFPKAVSDQVDDLRSSVSSLQKVLAKAALDIPPAIDLHDVIKVMRSDAARSLEEISISFRELLGVEGPMAEYRAQAADVATSPSASTATVPRAVS